MSIIDTANALSLPAFRAKFLPALSSHSPVLFALNTSIASTATPRQYNIELESGRSLPAFEFLACFDLIRSTSYEAYQASCFGWFPSKKRKEMRLRDMRYLLVKSTGNDAQHAEVVEGFLSFMLTYEDGYEVIYCYEIHLEERLRGSGVGTQLMGMMEEVGRTVGVAKAMLTVFVENQAAMRFYRNLGYVEDESSPAPRKLRNGVVKDPTYLILSKSLAPQTPTEW